jgi:hypothetical protein
MPSQLARMSHLCAFIYPILYAEMACMHASWGIMMYVEVIVGRASSAEGGYCSFPGPYAYWGDPAPEPV